MGINMFLFCSIEKNDQNMKIERHRDVKICDTPFFFCEDNVELTNQCCRTLPLFSSRT
jgi:hypothetical protein